MADLELPGGEERIRAPQAEDARAPQEQTLAALRDSEERLRALLNTAVEGIIVIDRQGRIQSLNPAGEKMFGYSAAEAVGRNVSMLMPSPDREQHDHYLENYLRTGRARIIGVGREVVGRRKDGSLFPMYLSVGEARLHTGIFFTGIARDITGQKEAERRLEELAHSLTEKNRELETIFYVASHDLRSPLVNIQGFSKELARSCAELRRRLAAATGQSLNDPEIDKLLADDIPESIAYIQAGVQKIDTLLNGFLRFSRLGRAALRVERLKMGALIKAILHAMEFQVKRSGARVEVGPLPDCVGDAAQINQVFSNLLDNALKYLSPERPGEIQIRGQSEGRQAIYAVADNGIGIEPQHQQKIFEIFHRLNPGTIEGEGLGLTITQRILERHHGKIWVESQPGQGSVFFVALPNALSISPSNPLIP